MGLSDERFGGTNTFFKLYTDTEVNVFVIDSGTVRAGNRTGAESEI